LFAGGHIWAGGSGGSIGRVDVIELTTAGATIADRYAAGAPSSLAFDGTYIWAALAHTGINEATGVGQIGVTDGFVRLIDTAELGLSSIAVAFADGRIWSANGPMNTLTELPRQAQASEQHPAFPRRTAQTRAAPLISRCTADARSARPATSTPMAAGIAQARPRQHKR